VVVKVAFQEVVLAQQVVLEVVVLHHQVQEQVVPQLHHQFKVSLVALVKELTIMLLVLEAALVLLAVTVIVQTVELPQDMVVLVKTRTRLGLPQQILV
jgi:hypothetical protein